MCVTGQPGQQPAPQFMAPPPAIPGVPPGLEYISQIDQLLVHQQIELFECKSVHHQFELFECESVRCHIELFECKSVHRQIVFTISSVDDMFIRSPAVVSNSTVTAHSLASCSRLKLSTTVSHFNTHFFTPHVLNTSTS